MTAHSASSAGFNLDSSIGFSRRGAEVAEYAEKVATTEAFRLQVHTGREKTIHPNGERPSCSKAP